MVIKVMGHVDEQHRLHAELPAEVKPGPVRIIVQPAIEDDEDAHWLALIDQSWAKDWSDPRDDIYSLEDGRPSHEPG